jgi:hypothetical protein
MKIRNGFVSNSSSSSFIIFKEGLSYEQIKKIKNHSSIAQTLCEQGTRLNYMYSYEDAWSINETDLTIEGYTHMDNFSMGEYLRDFVKVDEKYIRWEY